MIACIIIVGIGLAWLMRETDWLRVNLFEQRSALMIELEQLKMMLEGKLTKLERAEIKARIDILELSKIYSSDPATWRLVLQDTIADIENELGNRSMPFHGGAHNKFPGLTAKELAAQQVIYEYSLTEVS